MSAPINVGVVMEMTHVTRLLSQTEHAAKDLTPVFQGPIDASVTEFYKRQFETEGAHGGQKWENLSPLTVTLKGRNGRGRAGPETIGRDTNRLWASLTKSGGPMSLRHFGPKEYVRGTRVRHAQWFHEGYDSTSIFGRTRKGGTRKVPARPIVPETMPQPIIRAWEGMIVHHILST